MIAGKAGEGPETPRRSEVAKKLQQCAGDLFKNAREEGDYGCLVELPLVQDKMIVTKGGVIAGQQQAIESAIRLAASTLRGDYRIVKGKVPEQTIAITANQAARALLASFGLDSEPTLNAELRRAKVRNILGLTCRDSTYRGRPRIVNPERNLMEILAAEIIRQGQTVEGARIEDVAFIFHLKVIHAPECPSDCKIAHTIVTERLDVTRTVRATLDEASFIVEPWEVNIDSPIRHYESTSDQCSFDEVRSDQLVIGFPKLRHGEAKDISYSITFAPYENTRNAFAIRPAGPYDTAFVCAILPPEIHDSDTCLVYGFREERDCLPHQERLDLITPDESGICGVGVIQPSPHLWLGLNIVDSKESAGRYSFMVKNQP